MNKEIICPNGQKVNLFALLGLKAGLKLETLGFKRHGESAYSQTKRLFLLKGSKQNVLKELEEILLKNGVSIIRGKKQIYPLKYKCPFCDYKMNEEELESVCDVGCPSCRKYFDAEDCSPI